MALAFVFALGAFPTSTQAYYSYGNNYGCPRPFVYPNGYFYCPTPATPVTPPPVVVNPPPVVVTPPPPVYQALSATCYPSTAQVNIGNSVQWVAYASGGNGNYAYTWNGTDGFNSNGQAAYMTYYSSGVKTASVTVYSGAQSAIAYCTSAVTVNDPYFVYQQPVVYQQAAVYGAFQNNNSGLDIGCYADPSTAYVNQPVNWKVEVTRGLAPYRYSWTGTDGLSGDQASIVKYYDTVGTKSAIVTITSADGKTGTHACSTGLTIRGSGASRPAAPVAPVAPVAPAQQNDNNLGASAYFSLNNVPWGWVAVLVILVLFSACMYLLFNKSKM